MWKNDFLIFDNFLCGVSFNLSTPTYTINHKEYLHLTLVLIHIYWKVKLFIRKPIADVESKDLNILQISKWLTQWRPKIFVTSFIWSIPPPLDFPPSAGVEYLSLSTLALPALNHRVLIYTLNESRQCIFWEVWPDFSDLKMFLRQSWAKNCQIINIMSYLTIFSILLC